MPTDRTHDTAPAWFRAAIITGLQRLVALRLEGAPPADAIAATAETWISTLWDAQGWIHRDGAEQDDLPRIAAAFQALAQTRETWPAPVHLRRSLPSAAHLRALPPPPPTPPERAEACARLRALRAELRERQPEAASDAPVTRHRPFRRPLED